MVLWLAGHTGCHWLHLHHKPTPAQLKEQAKLRGLETRANDGDRKAARELAKWHYLHDNNTTQVQHWLRVAEKNGDRGSGLVANQMQGWQ